MTIKFFADVRDDFPATVKEIAGGFIRTAAEGIRDLANNVLDDVDAELVSAARSSLEARVPASYRSGFTLEGINPEDGGLILKPTDSRPYGI